MNYVRPGDLANNITKSHRLWKGDQHDRRLYEEVLNVGVFQEAYSLGGLEDTEDVEELKITLEEYGKKLDGTPDRNIPAEKYADE